MDAAFEYAAQGLSWGRWVYENIGLVAVLYAGLAIYATAKTGLGLIRDGWKVARGAGWLTWNTAKLAAWPVAATVRRVRKAYTVDRLGQLLLDAIKAGPCRLTTTTSDQTYLRVNSFGTEATGPVLTILVVGDSLRFEPVSGAKLEAVYCGAQRIDGQLNGSRKRVLAAAQAKWDALKAESDAAEAGTMTALVAEALGKPA